MSFAPRLRVRGNRLAADGVEVHAATFLREGRIVLDSALARQPGELRRIFVHELFHFVWWKLGNPKRRSWEAVLAREMASGVRGELGWSAELRKKRLSPLDVKTRSRAWREYCCESFCDCGASIFAGASEHEEFTLAERYRERRRRWLSVIIRDEEDLVQFVNPESGRDGFVWLNGMRCLFPLAHR